MPSPIKKQKNTSKNLKSTKNNIKELKPKTIKCEFCEKRIPSEEFENHLCPKMKRLKDKNKKEFITGFFAYKVFKKFNSVRKLKAEPTIEDFVKFRNYNSFLKFGKRYSFLGVKEVEQFMLWICKNQIHTKVWLEVKTYDNWLIKKSINEDPIDASESAIQLMLLWENTTGNNWFDFFREVNTEIALEFVSSGKLSPWLLFSGIANSLLERMSDSQLDRLTSKLNIDVWTQQITDHYDELNHIKEVYKEYGII